MNPSPSAMYNGIIHAAGKISSTEGIRSLWRGIASVAVGAGKPCSSVSPPQRTGTPALSDGLIDLMFPLQVPPTPSTSPPTRA